ncbi:CBU_0592 family membrane protein [Brevundimonas sp.]|uniref:CBU_0592 family membrane protein n=1 Tax=Brevundimonas sp. TaxID=1871086 RepID=UPI002FC879D2
MTLPDMLGVFGVLLILAAYAGATMTSKLDPARAPALMLNLAGALLILLSLYFDFNLSAVLMEGSWALVSIAGLARLALGIPRKRA